MPRIEREAAKLKDAHLLEVGCGMGFDSIEFLKRGVRVTTTDLTPTAVELTRCHFEIAGIQAEDVRVENVLDLSFHDNTFDAVWACGVLHHTGNTEKAISETPGIDANPFCPPVITASTRRRRNRVADAPSLTTARTSSDAIRTTSRSTRASTARWSSPRSRCCSAY